MTATNQLVLLTCLPRRNPCPPLDAVERAKSDLRPISASDADDVREDV